MLAPFEIISKEIEKAIKAVSIFCLYPKYEIALINQLADLKSEIDRLLWSEDMFFFVLLHPKETGCDEVVLAPCRYFKNGPYILIPKKGFTLKTARTKDDYETIYIRTLEEIKGNKKCSRNLKKFLVTNQYALTKHWAVIVSSGDFINELVKI